MNEESMLYGMPLSQLKDVIYHYRDNVSLDAQELMKESLHLRAKVSFYESRIRQMAMSMEEKT